MVHTVGDNFDKRDDEYRYPVITTTTANNGVDGFYCKTDSEGNCIVSGGEAKPSSMQPLILKLPATPSGDPDWQFMGDYIRSLPYGDRLPSVPAA